VKFEIRFGILSRENPCSAKNEVFHAGWSILFFKQRRFENSAAFWFFGLEDTRNTWCLCAQSSKSKLVKAESEISSFLTQGETLIAHKIQVKQEQQQQNRNSFAQV
jgi:hypothetical protein